MSVHGPDDATAGHGTSTALSKAYYLLLATRGYCTCVARVVQMCIHLY